MEIDLIEIWASMNNLVRAVVVVLTIQALACITVVIDRVLMLLLSQHRARRFAREAGPRLGAGDYDAALRIAKQHGSSHLASFIETGLDVFLARQRDGMSREKAAEMSKRALERKGENLSDNLNRGMNVLASTGSTAPFIGLLGTVLGILNAFKMIAEEGSGGMGTIGSSIAEALIVTGYGLMVAIPSVLVFNWLNGRIAKYESGLANAGSELVDQLEAGTVRREGESGETELEQAPRAVASAA
ncbi:MAG: MotA/TolQ/ExbB proton channel family protein [Sandaracinaceae bacterium]|nr:MotA/TolQ/ExbB proton channel family protein [Sandaracinaceae bacterium]